MMYKEPLEHLFTSSRLMILDFAQIPAGLRAEENIKLYFDACFSRGVNPRLPENRQLFNGQMIDACNTRYLVSRFAEDRSAMLAGSQIATEGRTLHLGIDIFSKSQEPVFAPCNGKIVRAAREPGEHSYGYYVMLQPADPSDFYFFMGHLSKDLPPLGPVHAGQQIATTGDYIDNENGGWSRHLHLQLVYTMPSAGKTPDGYASKEQFSAQRTIYRNPLELFPDWQISTPKGITL